MIAVYVFTGSGNTWSQVQKLEASDGAAGDNLGWSVALDGNTALVGAPFATVGSEYQQGAAYLFTLSGNTWSEAQKLTASDRATSEYFGFSVAVNGTTAVIGAPYANGDTSGSGAAYAFHSELGNWNETQKLAGSDSLSGNQFGYKVALKGNVALFGGPFADIDANTEQGAAYVFNRDDGGWSQEQKLVTSDGVAYDNAAFAVATSETTAVVGLPNATIDGHAYQGAAYFYQQSPTPTPTPTPTSTPCAVHAYISNADSNNVSVIDTSDNSVVATVALANSPYGVAITPDDARAYVTNPTGNSVSVIDTATNTVVATVSVGNIPYGVAITPDGTRAYVTNNQDDSVSVINTATNTVVATVAVGTFPYGVAINANGSRVYVANEFSSDVSVIDTSTNTVVATVAVGNAPYGVAITPDGARAYVANFTSNNVSVIDTSTNTVVATVAVGSAPFGVAIAPDGTRAYAANAISNNVSVIDTSTNTVVARVAVGNDPRPLGNFIGALQQCSIPTPTPTATPTATPTPTATSTPTPTATPIVTPTPTATPRTRPTPRPRPTPPPCPTPRR